MKTNIIVIINSPNIMGVTYLNDDCSANCLVAGDIATVRAICGRKAAAKAIIIYI